MMLNRHKVIFFRERPPAFLVRLSAIAIRPHKWSLHKQVLAMPKSVLIVRKSTILIPANGLKSKKKVKKKSKKKDYKTYGDALGLKFSNRSNKKK